ncbi:MAG TPA: hypothetical protein V6D10_16920 [Trichocoleus sp.]|jgi:hypothetical protein
MTTHTNSYFLGLNGPGEPTMPVSELAYLPASTSGKQQEVTEQNQYTVESYKPTDSIAAHLIWLIPVWGVIVWLLLACTTSEIWKILRYKPTELKKSHQVPCRNCQFFSSNFYLKCAVRPTDALTDRATDCSDYCPRQIAEVDQQKPTNVRN